VIDPAKQSLGSPGADSRVGGEVERRASKDRLLRLDELTRNRRITPDTLGMGDKSSNPFDTVGHRL
jgi:hypothetical protein